MVVLYQNRSFSWPINKIGSESQKKITFGSGESFWEIISEFHLGYIKLDLFLEPFMIHEIVCQI